MPCWPQIRRGGEIGQGFAVQLKVEGIVRAVAVVMRSVRVAETGRGRCIVVWCGVCGGRERC